MTSIDPDRDRLAERQAERQAHADKLAHHEAERRGEGSLLPRGCLWLIVAAIVVWAAVVLWLVNQR